MVVPSEAGRLSFRGCPYVCRLRSCAVACQDATRGQAVHGGRTWRRRKFRPHRSANPSRLLRSKTERVHEGADYSHAGGSLTILFLRSRPKAGASRRSPGALGCLSAAWLPRIRSVTRHFRITSPRFWLHPICSLGLGACPQFTSRLSGRLGDPRIPGLDPIARRTNAHRAWEFLTNALARNPHLEPKWRAKARAAAVTLEGQGS